MRLLLLLLLAASPAFGQSFGSEQHDFRLVKVLEGLDQPWSLAFLPDGRMLVTEKRGRLRVVEQGKLLVAAIADIRALTLQPPKEPPARTNRSRPACQGVNALGSAGRIR